MVRAGRHLVEPEVLREEEVAQQLHEVLAGFATDLAERPALPAGVLRPPEVAEPDVGDPAGPRVHDAARLELVADPGPHRRVGEALLRRARVRPPGPRSGR